MTDLAPKLVNFLDDLVWDAHFPICQMGTRMPVPTPTPRRENKHVNLGGGCRSAHGTGAPPPAPRYSPYFLGGRWHQVDPQFQDCPIQKPKFRKAQCIDDQ